MSINFFNFQLIINGKDPTPEDFQSLFSEDYKNKNIFDDNKTMYKIVEKENIENNYVWIYVECGAQYPYGKKVIDKESKEEGDNPKASNQIEMNHQIFILYSFERHTLYISNRQGKSFVQQYLGEQLKKDVIIKSYIVVADEFLEKISIVNNIKLVSKSGLLSEHYNMNDIVPSSKDIFGLENPETYEIKVIFKQARKTHEIKAIFKKARKNSSFIEKFKKLSNETKNHEIDSLVCVGIDDNGIENIFNMDSLTEKLPFECAPDEYKQYNPHEIKNTIIQALNQS